MAAQRIREPRTGAAAQTVLVVEDELLVRLAIAEHLRDCGYTVVEVDNAQDAIAVFTCSRFDVDVLFTDVRLRGAMDGFALARWVHANKPAVKVIITSGIGRWAEDAAKVCADSPFIHKPYNPAYVEGRIRQLIAERTAPPQA
jgi:CheY-like chemotaxis protein